MTEGVVYGNVKESSKKYMENKMWESEKVAGIFALNSTGDVTAQFNAVAG